MADEKFTIKEILDYPDKVFTALSGISLTGILKYVGEGREVQGTKGTFWSQFIVIEDSTGKIGADKSGDTKEDVFPQSAKGKQVTVEGAKTKLYEDKNKKTERKLTRGKISLTVEQPKGESKDTSGVTREGYDRLPNEQYVVSREEWAKKDRTITRVAVVKSLIEAGKKPDPDTIDEANLWFDWIYYTGDSPDLEKPKTKEKKKTKSSKKSSVEQVADENFDRKKEETKLLKLYTQACTLKLFDAKYDLSKWMYEQFEKKTVGSLADDQVADAVRLMGEKVEEIK